VSFGLTILLLTQAAAPAEPLICHASFYEEKRRRFGNAVLVTDQDYTPRGLTISINELDGWSRAEVRLDATDRRLPGVLTSAFFAIRFTRRPAYPLTMNVYADEALRWRKTVDTPFWPTTLFDQAGVDGHRGAASDRKRARGTSGHVARADDGLEVSTPRELKIVVIDAKGRQVGERRYALLGNAPEDSIAKALAAVESGYRDRRCTPPPPPIH
jgi:hypothetical protein